MAEWENDLAFSPNPDKFTTNTLQDNSQDSHHPKEKV